MLAFLLVLVAVQSVAEVPSPRPDGWVTDQAGVLDEPTRARLNTLANELEARRGIELAIVTVDQVPGSPKAFATRLFAHWKIGKAATNNGVLVLLVMGQRRLEIETGSGIEAALTASWLADMQASTMVPRFKARDFPGGLVAGVAAISAHLLAAPGESTSTEPTGAYRDDGNATGSATAETVVPTPHVPAPTPAYEPPRESSNNHTPLAVAGGIGALGVGGGALFARTRRKRRICEKDNMKMLPLDELADDAHLDAGQQAEERVGSVNYEVLICPVCQASRTLKHGKWFSGYDRCSGCSYKTNRSTSTTISHATYDHGGSVRVDEHCSHCSRSHSYTRSTPRRTRPSTTTSSSTGRSSFSSSSRSSGFGGGSSRGGGAGSSW